MNKILLLLLLCTPVVALTQPQDTAYNYVPPQITYSILPDSGYTLKQILTNKSLPFVAGGALQPGANPFYWLKITFNNPSPFAGKYALRADPCMLNTFYYFDANAKQWLTSLSGIQAGVGDGVSEGYAPNLVMQAQMVNTVYAKMNVGGLKKYNVAIKPTISFKNQDELDGRLKILLAGWLITVSVVFFFFLSNLYVYFSLKDRSVLHYLIVQVGA